MTSKINKEWQQFNSISAAYLLFQHWVIQVTGFEPAKQQQKKRKKKQMSTMLKCFFNESSVFKYIQARNKIVKK